MAHTPRWNPNARARRRQRTPPLWPRHAVPRRAAAYRMARSGPGMPDRPQQRGGTLARRSQSAGREDAPSALRSAASEENSMNPQPLCCTAPSDCTRASSFLVSMRRSARGAARGKRRELARRRDGRVQRARRGLSATRNGCGGRSQRQDRPHASHTAGRQRWRAARRRTHDAALADAGKVLQDLLPRGGPRDVTDEE
jgi:hypothetical protein